MITTARKKLEADLANLVKAISYWDIHIENYRIGMAENHQFDVRAAFMQIDIGRQNLVTERSVHQFMSANQMNCSHKESEQIFITYLSQGENGIDYEQFAEFILPKTNTQLKQYHLNKNDNTIDKIQLQFIRESLKRFFERILTATREINKIREHINTNSHFDIHELWKIISEKSPVSTGNLTFQCLLTFIKGTGSHFNELEFSALLRNLNIKEERDYITQIEFNYLVMPPQFIISSNFNDEIKERVAQKFYELGIQQPIQQNQYQINRNDQYNFRKVFDPVREGRPQFTYDRKYMDQLREYKAKYLAPSRNYELQYGHNPQKIRDHDFFFQDFYLHIHNSDQEELYFNRFGKRYAF